MLNFNCIFAFIIGFFFIIIIGLNIFSDKLITLKNIYIKNRETFINKLHRSQLRGINQINKADTINYYTGTTPIKAPHICIDDSNERQCFDVNNIDEVLKKRDYTKSTYKTPDPKVPR